MNRILTGMTPERMANLSKGCRRLMLETMGEEVDRVEAE